MITTMSRKQRIQNRHRNQLRCEACNKYTNVTHELYKYAMDTLDRQGKEIVFFCRRERCIKSRPEGLVPEKKERPSKER